MINRFYSQNIHKKKESYRKYICNSLIFKSGWQDSNLRPPAPKAGAITGLRYTPSFFYSDSGKSLPQKNAFVFSVRGVQR